eukprot:m51a1_g7628 hypothetical protein (300) ;mRNA; f:314060-315168
MKVFVTGATGYIGGEVVRALLSRGHEVTSLVRGDASRAPAGSTALVGTLQQASEWIPVAVQHDAIVHCAFDSSSMDTEGYSTVCYKDAELTVSLAEAAKKAGRTKVMVITTTLSLVLGQPGTPDEYAATDRMADCEKGRLECETRLFATAAPGFRTCSVRPGWVYGGPGGMLAFVKDQGTPFVVEGGSADVALVTVQDLARLYVFLVEHESCSGPFHGAADGNTATWRQVAQRLSDAMHRNGKIRNLSLSQARKEFGFLSDFLVVPFRGRSTKAHEVGFEWKDPALLDDFDRYVKELSC